MGSNQERIALINFISLLENKDTEDLKDFTTEDLVNIVQEKLSCIEY